MVFIWRGAGIMVPIAIFISAWLTGYKFDDESISNAPYMAWTLLWAGIALSLIGLALFPIQKDPETQQKRYVAGHDFFWIPMIAWGIVLLGVSTYLFVKPAPEDKYASYREEIAALADGEKQEPEMSYDEFLQSEDSHKMPSGLTYAKNPRDIKDNQRVVKLFNPTKAAINISIVSKEDPENNSIEGEVPSLGVTFIALDEGNYTVSYPKFSKDFYIKASQTTHSYDTDDLWLILGKGTDLLLVDVTETAYEKFSKEELTETDWSEMVKERYSGTDFIEVNMKREFEKLFYIRDPYYSLPIKHNEAEQIFALIPIPSNKKTSDEYLDYFLTNLCFKSDEFTVH